MMRQTTSHMKIHKNYPQTKKKYPHDAFIDLDVIFTEFFGENRLLLVVVSLLKWIETTYLFKTIYFSKNL